jgi:hypothetical protein
VELFDVERDPEELSNLAGDPSVDARELVEHLEAFAAGVSIPLPVAGAGPGGSFPATDAETRERLRELGYLE